MCTINLFKLYINEKLLKKEKIKDKIISSKKKLLLRINQIYYIHY